MAKYGGCSGGLVAGIFDQGDTRKEEDDAEDQIDKEQPESVVAGGAIGEIDGGEDEANDADDRQNYS